MRTVSLPVSELWLHLERSTLRQGKLLEEKASLMFGGLGMVPVLSVGG